MSDQQFHEIIEFLKKKDKLDREERIRRNVYRFLIKILIISIIIILGIAFIKYSYFETIKKMQSDRLQEVQNIMK